MRTWTPPRLTLALAACLWAGPGWCQAPYRLDTSASPRAQVAATHVTDERGQPLAFNPFPQQINARFGRVEYRVATAAFAQRRARIDIVLPAVVRGVQRPSGLVFRWRGVDGTLDGQLSPGQRLPLWVGTVSGPLTSLVIDLDIQLDVAALSPAWNGGEFGVEPAFELVVLP